MCQTPIMVETLHIIAQTQHFLLSPQVIPINRRRSVPQRFVELDLPAYIEGMAHGNPHLVESPKFFHTALQIRFAGRIADPHIFQKGRDLIPVVRIDVDGIVAEAETADRPVNFRLLPAVDKLVCSFAGDPHDVLGALHAEEETSVGHALLEHAYVCDIAYAAPQSLAYRVDRVGLKVVGAGIQLTELLISVDLDKIGGAHCFGLKDHAVSLETGFP